MRHTWHSVGSAGAGGRPVRTATPCDAVITEAVTLGGDDLVRQTQRMQRLAMVLIWLTLVLVWGLTVWAVWTAAEMPTVYRAWPSGDCRAVRPAGDCADLPARHETVWVDPAWEGTR